MSVSGFLIWLSGANKELLAELPGDRAKYEGIGGVVLTTATMAAVSAGLAINLALQANIIICVLVGVAWGLAILNLDRWLISAFPRRDTVWKNFLQALPRFLMALIIGLVVSTPLVLRLFDHEIEEQIDKTQQTDQAAFQKRVEADNKVDVLQKRVNTDNDYIGATTQSGLVTGDKSVASVYKRLQDARTERDRLEADGSSPARLAQLRGQIPSLERSYSTARDNRVTSLHTTGRDNLAKDAPALARAKVNQKRQLDGYERRNADNRGLLTRISALQEVRGSNSTLGAAYGVLWAFITLIEVLPVLLKFLLSFGAPSGYERAQVTEDEEQLAHAQEKIRQRGKSRSERMQAKSTIETEKLKLQAEAAQEEMRARMERAAQRRSGSSMFGP